MKYRESYRLCVCVRALKMPQLNDILAARPPARARNILIAALGEWKSFLLFVRVRVCVYDVRLQTQMDRSSGHCSSRM